MSGSTTQTDDEIEQLLDDVVMVSDRNVFAHHPRREFRVRSAWELEIEQLERGAASSGLTITATPVPAGWCWWVLVWQVEPGAWFRKPFLAPHDLPPEPSRLMHGKCGSSSFAFIRA